MSFACELRCKYGDLLLKDGSHIVLCCERLELAEIVDIERKLLHESLRETRETLSAVLLAAMTERRIFVQH